MADQTHLDDIDGQGFTIVRNLLDADRIAGLHNRIHAVFRQAVDALPSEIGRPADLDSLDACYLFLKEKAPVMKSHVYDLLGRLDSVVGTLTDPRLVEIGENRYGTPMILGPSQIRIDDGSNDRLLPWHQELEQMSLMTLNIWVPLVDIVPGAGGLAVVPGSHKTGLRKHVFTEEFPTYFSLPPSDTEGKATAEVSMNAGDALVFHPFLYHRSLPNRGDRIRWTIVGRYNELRTMPYLRAADAERVMDRNPTADMPGCDFLSEYTTP